MKLVVAILSVFSINAFAQDLEQLICNDGGPDHEGTVYATLDSSHFTPGSGSKTMVSAGVYFNFSTAQDLTCEGYVHVNDYDVDCVGFYAGSREVTLVQFRTENGKIMAHWKTSRSYGSKERVSECRAKI